MSQIPSRANRVARLFGHGALRKALLRVAIAAIGAATAPLAANAQHGAPAMSSAANQPVSVAPGLHSRAPALSDPQFAVKAMQLTSAQMQALTQVNARYKPLITAYIATLNAALARGIPDDSLRPMQDSLHRLLVAVRASADSVVTPAQRKRFQDAMRLVHGATLPAQRTVSALPASPSRLVPIPTVAKRKP